MDVKTFEEALNYHNIKYELYRQLTSIKVVITESDRCRFVFTCDGKSFKYLETQDALSTWYGHSFSLGIQKYEKILYINIYDYDGYEVGEHVSDYDGLYLHPKGIYIEEWETVQIVEKRCKDNMNGEDSLK